MTNNDYKYICLHFGLLKKIRVNYIKNVNQTMACLQQFYSTVEVIESKHCLR